MKIEALSVTEERRLIASRPKRRLLVVKSERKAENIADYLREEEVAAQYLSSEIDPECVRLFIKQFLSGEIEVIVTTPKFAKLFPPDFSLNLSLN